LIGGRGNDVVKGGSGDDIVIGGFTDYDSSSDAHDQALMAIFAEWQSSDSYLTRIARIKAGVSGARFVFGTTVHDDGNSSKLTGGAGSDWFFKGAHDIITDLKSGETVN
jgi:Ca2+-binding RTX toxin-like protein